MVEVTQSTEQHVKVCLRSRLQ